MTDNANDILMGGGEGHPAWKFDAPGVRKIATVASPPGSHQEREYDPKTKKQGEGKRFPSGDPIMGVHVAMATQERDPADPEDDGVRTFWIDGKRLKQAVKAAVLASGAAGLEVGGVLDVTLTHYDDPNDRRSGRNWQITYQPPQPGNDALMGAPDPWATAGDPPQQQGYPQPQPGYAAPPQGYPPQQPAAPAGYPPQHGGYVAPPPQTSAAPQPQMPAAAPPAPPQQQMSAEEQARFQQWMAQQAAQQQMNAAAQQVDGPPY